MGGVVWWYFCIFKDSFIEQCNKSYLFFPGRSWPLTCIKLMILYISSPVSFGAAEYFIGFLSTEANTLGERRKGGGNFLVIHPLRHSTWGSQDLVVNYCIRRLPCSLILFHLKLKLFSL